MAGVAFAVEGDGVGFATESYAASALCATLASLAGALWRIRRVSSAEDIEWAHAEGIEVYCPPIQSKHGTDPFLPRRSDGPGVLAWRARMASEAGGALYKLRSICECIHARWRNWDLRQLTVRGTEKVRAVALLHALTNNILQGHRLATA
jgi:hypothetical protein